MHLDGTFSCPLHSMRAATFAINSLPKLEAHSDKKMIFDFIAKAKKKPTKILQSKDFNDTFQAQLQGKWADQATTTNTYPMVAAAKDNADEQKLLYERIRHVLRFTIPQPKNIQFLQVIIMPFQPSSMGKKSSTRTLTSLPVPC